MVFINMTPFLSIIFVCSRINTTINYTHNKTTHTNLFRQPVNIFIIFNYRIIIYINLVIITISV